MLKLTGKNSLSELFLYLNYIKSLENIDHSKTNQFHSFISSNHFKTLFDKVKNNKNEWITHKINGVAVFDFILNEKSVTFKTKHWFKNVEFNN